MSELDKLIAFIEAALRHADLPDNPGIDGVGIIEGEPGVIGVELTSGAEFFIEIKAA